jgi:hypothetical protein
MPSIGLAASRHSPMLRCSTAARALVPWLLLPSLLACKGGDTPSDDSASDTAPTGPCADGSYGHMDPAGVMVRVDGSDDEGDGSEERPYQTLARAHMTGATNISLGPGEFAGSYDLGYSETFSLTGCGPGETFIVADERVLPGLDVESLYLTYRGFTVRGGTVGLSIFSSRELTLEHIDVEESLNVGILINSVLDGILRHIKVSNIQPNSEMDAYGVMLVDFEALNVQDLSVRSMAAGIGIMTGAVVGTFQRVAIH